MKSLILKLMTLKYSRSLILAFLISIGISTFSLAQDSIQYITPVNRQEKALNVAYGTQPAWMVTGAISTIDGNDVEDPFTTHFTNRLFGRIPGLTVNASKAEPGNESNSMFSRGINTFGVAQTGMLILVDGIEANYSDLVPEEIESVSLLKDASATAMYGSRGANGSIAYYHQKR
ncbi:TonB-dependent receptor plug domain-containing protein [Seleniivibrio sp.]|uniref:TonB-dependent receptor plug domain-containing protein n=1 Tax=Seleniivibrio sp. TaxID=2898801 RepID=UPI0025FDCAD3|nr:TonB-dependent receptor plug domain-containing protein [Seleniivibrio sp.]MCD8554906.1 TonB-dependent receptor plug domain-containing protein [Seleniivibrio sp.]